MDLLKTSVTLKKVPFNECISSNIQTRSVQMVLSGQALVRIPFTNVSERMKLKEYMSLVKGDNHSLATSKIGGLLTGSISNSKKKLPIGIRVRG